LEIIIFLIDIAVSDRSIGTSRAILLNVRERVLVELLFKLENKEIGQIN